VHGDPSRCSQCLGAPVTVITQVGADYAVDGEIKRPIEPPKSETQLRYMRRGGKR
jgi:hypothetical protein